MNIDPRMEIIKLRHTKRHSQQSARNESLLREARKANHITRMQRRQNRRIVILNWAKQLTRLRIHVSLAPLEETGVTQVDSMQGSNANSSIHLNQA